MKTIYIAGKVRGLPFEEVVKKFAKAQDALKAQGYDVINPVEEVINYNVRRKLSGFDEWTEDKNRSQILRFCINRIAAHADGIYLLSDWHLSAGAMTEADIAVRLGLEILFEDPRGESVDVSVAQVNKPSL